MAARHPQKEVDQEEEVEISELLRTIKEVYLLNPGEHVALVHIVEDLQTSRIDIDTAVTKVISNSRNPTFHKAGFCSEKRVDWWVHGSGVYVQRMRMTAEGGND